MGSLGMCDLFCEHGLESYEDWFVFMVIGIVIWFGLSKFID